MKNIEDLRNEISEIDKDMAEIFVKRMNIVRDVAIYKKERGLKIFDEEREKKLIENNSKYIDDIVLRSYYMSFLKDTMDVSKQYQHRLLDGIKIACSGVQGAFSHIAATRIFPDGQFNFYNDFSLAYKSVETGECDCCVLPIENSYAGEVTQVTDLICSGSLFINGIYDLEICHNLLGLQDAKISDIKTVLSHPQALSQCEGYIREHGFDKIKQNNTALAAQMVAQGNDKSVAAIASKETAELYNLKILDHDINESNLNTTRFAVFSRVENILTREDSNFIMIFKVCNKAGALAKAISTISKYDFNMKVLRSRPIKEEPWQYYFYVEIEGNSHSEAANQMILELSTQCDRVKIAGNFLHEIKI